jgi:hypothetical protein
MQAFTRETDQSDCYEYKKENDAISTVRILTDERVIGTRRTAKAGDVINHQGDESRVRPNPSDQKEYDPHCDRSHLTTSVLLLRSWFDRMLGTWPESVSMDCLSE